MAEIFNNYLTKKAYNKNDSVIIVPSAGGNLSDYGIGSRKNGTVAQIHSIYITQILDVDATSDPLSEKAFVSLAVYDDTSAAKYYIAYNVLVLPHSAFYIEKTITLKPQQKLYLEYTNRNMANTKTLSAICSSIDIEQAE